MKGITKFVGLDVSKETIAVGVADRDGGGARFWGSTRNRVEQVRNVMRQLGRPEELLACYEAGPTGYGLQRQLEAMGIRCLVVAPSLTPIRPGDRVKTDRRDAVRLAELLRAGELTPVWVPGEHDEALRDLVRAREDAKQDLLRARHRLSKFLLRHELRAPEGVKNWTVRHRQWLDRLQLKDPVLGVVLREYRHALDVIEQRIQRLDTEIHEQATTSVHAPVIQALQTLRGVGEVTAVTMVAEVGSFHRFRNPRPLMAYAGVVPSEHSSGASRRQGGITKTGNAHLRRVLVEAAWAYRYPPAIKGNLRQRQQGQSGEVQAIAWQAQHRLHRRYRRMTARGKPRPVTVTAVARELLGFVWSIACQVEQEQKVQQAA